MRTLRIFPLMAVLLFAITNFSFAQKSKSESISVSGNCGMCKKTIEKAAKTAGASKADWDMNTKMLAVTYNASSTSAERIQQSIAAAGYDTRDIKADDKAYDKLHDCCKYDRAVTEKATCCDSDKCGKSENCCAGMDCCKDGKCSSAKTGKETQHDHGMMMMHMQMGQTVSNQAKTDEAAHDCCQKAAACMKKS